MMSPETIEAMLHDRRFSEIVALTPSEIQAIPATTLCYYRGVALVHLGRAHEALSELTHAATDPLLFFWSHHWLGRAHEAIDDPSSAAAAFLQASSYWEVTGNLAAFRGAAIEALKRSSTTDVRRAELYEQLEQVRTAVSGVIGEMHSPDVWVRQAIDGMTAVFKDLRERQRDIDIQLPFIGDIWPRAFRLETQFPVAIFSDDHVHPRGTAQDNTRSPRFVRACERQYGHELKAMDLGCSGGGLVRDFLLRGHRAIGLEGSDFSLKNQRAEWRSIPKHLNTCDILKPFSIFDDGTQVASFDIITAWEVLEHLPRELLPEFFRNVRRHLAPKGVFVASVALFEDKDERTGAVWHITLESQKWWEERLAEEGLAVVDHTFETADFVRGSGNGPADWNAVTHPEMGFHIVAGRRDA
ncbi:bifunctional 2-polyprenyl-6-hydroxyphenol methylase/3-demethylubiquinol 3-O-methyltransferase UbiG [Brevundimonas sp. EAKA]|uniref:class I SAM-dependent methyltransferase n=1 Tax=Brevundimonas sp. EAKA TaxID=1495854 RepID=UPI0009E032F9|nr:class I SAM-dependent methyltransferase [Brevundimonas sp. EAKA]